MAWVWVILTLAQFNNAENHRDTLGHLVSQNQVYNANDQTTESAPGDWGNRVFSVPVWSFLRGSGRSPEKGYNQPQYRCNDGMIYLRFSLVRHAHLRLEDGTRLLSLPDSCHNSIQIYRWWIMVKLPYSGCHTSIQAGDQMKYCPFKLHYFDRLLQENMTGMAVCKNSGMSPDVASPVVSCKTSITVKLPGGAKLRKVKELDFFTNEGFSVRQQNTPNALYVEISKLPDMDSGYELVYVDSTGKLCSMLAACSPKLQKKAETHHVRRSLNLFNLWGYDNDRHELFDPETPLIACSGTDTTSSVTDTEMDRILETNDGDISELWEFEDMPEEEYIGIDRHSTTPCSTVSTTIAIPCMTTAALATTATTAPPTTIPCATTAPPTTIPCATTAPPTTIPCATTAPPTTIPCATTAPPTTMPSSTSPPTTMPSSSTLPATMPSTSTPPATMHSSSTPPATMPSSSAPPATMPSSSTPPATMPSSSAPPATILSSSTPPATILSSSTPPSTMPSSSPPPSTMPSSSAPPATMPSSSAPPATMPSSSALPTTMPSSSALATTMPSSSAPPMTMPSSTLLPAAMPSSTLPPTMTSSNKWN